MQVTDVEIKYQDILEGLLEAQKHEYGGPHLQAMYREWWDYGRCVSGCVPIYFLIF